MTLSSIDLGFTDSTQVGKELGQGARNIGGRHSIEMIGLTPKRFPCCATTYKMLDIVLELKALHSFALDEVVETVTLGAINYGNLPHAKPENEVQAKFSMNFCVALVLVDGRARITDFGPEGGTAGDPPLDVDRADAGPCTRRRARGCGPSAQGEYPTLRQTADAERFDPRTI
jgi:2-methylcitrate dehydratase PrpD